MCSLLYTRVDGVCRLGRLEVLAVYRNGGFRGRAGGRVYIFVTVMVATGIMSPESQKASNSPHAIMEMGLVDSSGMSSGVGITYLTKRQPIVFLQNEGATNNFFNITRQQ